MTTKEAIEILKDHNLWRMSQGEYEDVKSRPRFSASAVGEAIDYAILKLKQYE